MQNCCLFNELKEVIESKKVLSKLKEVVIKTKEENKLFKLLKRRSCVFKRLNLRGLQLCINQRLMMKLAVNDSPSPRYTTDRIMYYILPFVFLSMCSREQPGAAGSGCGHV